MIGSCHVSSIFSHLGVTEQEKTIQNLTTPQNIELIVLDEETNNEQETKTENFTILKTTSVNETSVDLSKNGNVQKYKKIRCKSSLPLLKCNICPFVCLEESKIDEHLNKAHKNESNLILERLECPACINVFHHKISLRAHLSFDHQISNSDLMQVMQSFKNDFFKQTNNIKDIESNNESSTQCKDEFALKYMMNTEKILDTDSNIEEMNIIQSLNISENLEDESNLQVMKNIEHLGEPENSIVTLPIVDLTQNNAERKFTDMIKRTEKENKIYDIKTLLKCAFCKTRLSNRENMNYHVSCHFDTKYKCPECGEIFAVWKPLTGHLWRLHKIDMELFGCDKCEYKTPSLAKLNNIHKLIHSDFKGYSCDQCSKAFKNIKQLRNHKILHKDKSRDLSLYCDVCKRPYFDKRQLRLHMDSVHKKLKPYLCNFCGYKGTTKHSLKMHTRQHTGYIIIYN